MPVYKYVALNAQKQKVKGKYIAANEKDLAAQLAKNNLYLVSSSVSKEGTPSAFFTLGTGKVSIKELTAFCRQFAIMLTAGIPVLSCLDNLKKQKFSHYFRSILEVVYDDVKSGSLLYAAFDKHAKVFPHFFRSMVHVGQASGRLHRVFESLADYYESDAKIKTKVKAALAYPLMLLGMTVAVVIMMLAFVVPTFKDTMAALEVEITGFTKTVYDISDFFILNWRFLVVGILLGGSFLYLFMKTEGGKYIADVTKLHMPFFGRIERELVTARFSRSFSILLSSGMTMAEALNSLDMVIGNRYLRKRFKRVSRDIRNGVSLTTALKNFRYFPDMLIQMVAVGEKTAALGEVMTRTYKYFDERVETALNAATAKIQPVMLLIMGLTVGSLFIAVYSPMLSIMTQLG